MIAAKNDWHIFANRVCKTCKFNLVDITFLEEAFKLTRFTMISI